MGYQLNADALNTVFAKWSDTYDIYAPKLFAGTGRSSMQDIARYGKIGKRRFTARLPDVVLFQ